MSNFRPRLFAPMTGESPMKNLLLRKTRLMLLGAMLCVSLTTLPGCSVPTKIASEEHLPTPAGWSEPQLPGARDFSEKAQSFLLKVQTYFKETPEFTTQQ